MSQAPFSAEQQWDAAASSEIDTMRMTVAAVTSQPLSNFK